LVSENNLKQNNSKNMADTIQITDKTSKGGDPITVSKQAYDDVYSKQGDRYSVFTPPVAPTPAPAAGALNLGGTPTDPNKTPGAIANLPATTLQPAVPATKLPEATPATPTAPAPTFKDTYNDAYSSMASKEQDVISKIEGYYKNVLGQADTEAAGREAAINALVGSGQIAGVGAGASAVRGSQKTTEKAYATATSQMAKDIADVMQNVATNAMTLANNITTDRANIKASAISNLDTLAKLGKSSDEIKAADPSLYQNLLDQTGFSDYQLASYIDSNDNNPNKPTVKEVPMPSADGNSTVIKRITFDPKTGKSTEKDYTVNVPFASYQGEQIAKTTDGKMLQQMPDGTYKDITPGISGATTTNQKDYEYYAAQEKAAGKVPQTFDEWQTNAKAPAAVKEYNAAVKAGFTGSMIEYTQQKKGAGATLDAETVNFMASEYMTTGKVPSFGMGVAGMAARTQFYKAVADMAATQGKSGQQVAASQMAAKSAAAALTNQTKLNAATEQAEKAAIKNADYAFTLASKLDKYQMPDANKFTNWVNGKLGNKDLTAFEVALFTATREYAKVASGSAGSVAGLTESAQKEAAALLSSAMNLEQLKSAIDTMKVDMENVKESQTSTESQLRQDIVDYGGAPETPVTPTTPTDGGGGSGDTSFDSIWD